MNRGGEKNLFNRGYADLLFILFFAVLAASALFPYIFQGKIFANLDTTSLFYPFFDFYHKAITDGESFLWNPSIFSGFPTYLSQSGGFFDPVNRLIFSFFDGVNGLHLRLFLDYFLVLVFSYLAGRSFGVSHFSSSLIGIAYLSSFHIIYISNPILANTIFLSPFLLWIFRNAISAGLIKKILWITLGGIGLGWALLSGNAQITVYILSLFVLFLAVYFWLVWEGEKNFRSIAVFAIIITAIVIVGVLVSLPQILASAKHTPLTSRSGGLPYEITAGRNIGPWDFILFLFPNYLYFPYLSEGRYAMYIGAFMFFMALSAITFAASRLKLFLKRALSSEETDKFKLVAVFATVAVLALAASFWKSPISYILQHLPVFKFFRYIDRWMFVGAFYWAFVGALGFDVFYKHGKEYIFRIVFNITGAVVWFIAALTFALNFFGEKFWSGASNFLYLIFSKFAYGNFGFGKEIGHYREAIDRGIEAWRDFLSLNDFTFFLPFFILIFSHFLIKFFINGSLSWDIFKRIGVLISAATLVFIFSAYWPSNSIARESVALKGDVYGQFFPHEERNLYRIVPFMIQQGFAEVVEPGYKIKAKDEIAFTELKLASAWPNINSLSGVLSADGYDPFVQSFLREALEEIGSTHAGQDATKKLSNSEIINRFVGNLDVWGMMSGKYVVSGFKLDSPDLELLGEEKVSRLNIPLYFYENLKAIPRFYYAKKTVDAPGASLVALLRGNKKDFINQTYLDCEKCGIGQSVEVGAAIDPVTLKNGFIKMKTQSRSRQWLVVSESFLPGWQANLDGVNKKMIRANGIYMALEIPPGEHEVVLNYEGVLNEAKILRAIGFIK